MTIDLRLPRPSEEPRLKAIFTEAFTDAAFTELFFRTAFSPNRCFVAAEGEVLGALHWFDCALDDKKLAYLYGIAVSLHHRSRGIGGAMIRAALAHLENQGYAAALLVPADEGLRRYYERLGFRNSGSITEETVCAGAGIPIVPLSPAAYAEKRRRLLPEGGIRQERECLELLAGYGDFWDCGSAIAAVSGQMVWELLGDPSCAPGLIAALGHPSARVRTPGGAQPFAMAKWFGQEKHIYFGLSFE